MENHQSNQPFKLIALGLGSVIAIAHIGVLGHLINATNQKPVMPSINLPTGPYSSYDVNVGKEGYSIRYNANDPKTLKSERTLDLDVEITLMRPGKNGELMNILLRDIEISKEELIQTWESRMQKAQIV